MSAMRSDMLDVPGARLYHEVRGSGPLLLVLQGGEGDAERTKGLVARLDRDHTVVTYDRRGLSRSVPGDPGALITVERHADDVHRLLAALTTEPALLLGSSYGGLIGLALASRHPEQVGTLVVHEPPALSLLTPGARADADAVLARLEETYRDEGWGAAFKMLAEVTGAGFADREPDVELPPPVSRERIANMHFFFTHDIPATRHCELDVPAIAALKGTSTRVVPAAGRTTARGFFDHACAEELALLLGTEVAEFPGGHNGLTSHPKAFAARLREVFDAAV
ncbi:alpha/beta hydrolase [Sphaerisporangium krabiense]|uniref:Pimeloyl-ACP methyl ester carboxylesterase n=1 Tax=Sphaerisporangium krabiense TaxID=763782 RepID=A0A7W9DPN6_9ACTN|nr:alpha/beta hydrolase [Sphaerisporangium krabiense]MBB5625540.1 pimeloyl-ACP methyl ester carboxylesterase [Sphaerisporangium krabiense]GII63130.1 alpha/beta hydrolase [Sphaerisporangium krabiense]